MINMVIELTEQEKRAYRVCFTGHRPERLRIPEEMLRNKLKKEIFRAYEDGYRTFITGMAKGVDIIAGELVFLLASQHDDVRLICAVPFEGAEKGWPEDWKTRYSILLQYSHLTWVISPIASKDAYQKRNEWMVDHASRVIAVYDGKPEGGTYNTLRYAKRQGLEICVIEPGL